MSGEGWPPHWLENVPGEVAIVWHMSGEGTHEIWDHRMCHSSPLAYHRYFSDETSTSIQSRQDQNWGPRWGLGWGLSWGPRWGLGWGLKWGLRCPDEANLGKYLFCISKTNKETNRSIIIKSRQSPTEKSVRLAVLPEGPVSALSVSLSGHSSAFYAELSSSRFIVGLNKSFMSRRFVLSNDVFFCLGRTQELASHDQQSNWLSKQKLSPNIWYMSSPLYKLKVTFPTIYPISIVSLKTCQNFSIFINKKIFPKRVNIAQSG